LYQVKRGDVVSLVDDRIGVVRYVGELRGHVSTDVFYGIEIYVSTEACDDDCDGSYNNKQYFSADHQCGTFKQREDILHIVSSEVCLLSVCVIV